MATTPRRRPEVEPLEDRLVLSAGHVLQVLSATPHHVHHPKHHPHHRHHRRHHHGGGTAGSGTTGGTVPGSSSQAGLSGQVTGTWDSVPTLPDVGKTQELQGSGTVAPFGDVSVRGELHTPGFVAQGRTTGTFTLSNANGTVTLALTGPLQPGFSEPPSSFQYTITGGTGAYASASGSGTAAFAEQPEVRPVCPPGLLCPQYIIPGTFTLVFQPAAA